MTRSRKQILGLAIVSFVVVAVMALDAYDDAPRPERRWDFPDMVWVRQDALASGDLSRRTVREFPSSRDWRDMDLSILLPCTLLAEPPTGPIATLRVLVGQPEAGPVGLWDRSGLSVTIDGHTWVAMVNLGPPGLAMDEESVQSQLDALRDRPDALELGGAVIDRTRRQLIYEWLVGERAWEDPVGPSGK